MARPREFDRDQALDRAVTLFWDRGFAATSTDQLVKAMGLGRQSLYNTFGDKRTLYLEALAAYHEEMLAGHLARLSGPDSPLDGIRELLAGVGVEDDSVRARGCLGVSSIEEFGVSDPDVLAMSQRTDGILGSAILARVREGQALGEIDRALDPASASTFIRVTMTGLQVSARAGSSADDLRRAGAFAAGRLAA